MRALQCAQWCAWHRRMPARPIRSCISLLRTAPSFRCVRVVVGGCKVCARGGGGVYSRDEHLSLCVTLPRCDTQTWPPSLPPSIFPLCCHSIFKYVYMQDAYVHARTHTHTHTPPPNKHGAPGQVVPTQTPIVDFPPPYVSLPKLVFPYPTQWLPSPAAAPRPLADTSVTICNWYVARI